jgi:hypothetical protein
MARVAARVALRRLMIWNLGWIAAIPDAEPF